MKPQEKQIMVYSINKEIREKKVPLGIYMLDNKFQQPVEALFYSSFMHNYGRLFCHIVRDILLRAEDIK